MSIQVPKPEEIRAALIDAAAAVSLSLPVQELLNATEVAGREEPWLTLLPGDNCQGACSGLSGDVSGLIVLALSQDLAKTVLEQAERPSPDYATTLIPVFSEAITSISTIIQTEIVAETPYEFDPKQAFTSIDSDLSFSSIELFDGDDHVATIATVFGGKNIELPFPENLNEPPPVETDTESEEDTKAKIEAEDSLTPEKITEEKREEFALEHTEFDHLSSEKKTRAQHPIDLLSAVEMQVTAELGRTRLPIGEILELSPGDLVELNRSASSPIDLLVNGTLIARGEVVVIDEEFAIRISEIIGTNVPIQAMDTSG